MVTLDYTVSLNLTYMRLRKNKTKKMVMAKCLTEGDGGSRDARDVGPAVVEED